MTILSKKKNIQGKQDVENAENQPHIPNPHSLPLQIANNQPKEKTQDIKEEGTGSKEEETGSNEEGTGSNDEENNTQNEETDVIPDDRIPQQCWSNVPLEERHSPLHNYEDQESGPSHGKRRHRASPLRSSRAKHRDRVGGSGSPSHCGSPSSSNLAVPGPSSSDACGYNSGDEYDHSHKAQLTEAQWIEEDRMFEKKMRKKGLTVKKMGEDGACLFRAVADQVYGDQEMHRVVRKQCMDYIMKNGDYFSQYVTEDFNTYVNRKRLDCTHGNHIEMQALSEMYNRTIEVFCYGKEPINIFHGVLKSDNEPIRLSYQRGSHYNSIVDPHKATIGVGLGLPSFTPGAADTNLVNDAIRQSEEFHIEQAMLEDKLRATDWEATNEAIEKHVAQDSYLQYLRDNDKRVKSMETGTSSSSIDRTSPAPQSSGHEQSTANAEVQNLMDMKMLPPEAFGLNEWDDAGILAQVIMESQREYLESLKRAASSPPSAKEDNLEQPSTSR